MARLQKMKGAATIKDVAQLAKVAPSTVSKVLNGSDRIGQETQARVQRAIKKLNYRPNSIARSLRKNHTRTIGIINNSHTNKNTFVLQMMVGVEEAAQAQGFSVFLCNSLASQARERDYIEVLLDKQVDGIIFLDNVVKERALPTFSDALPIVFLNQYVSESAFPSIVPDDAQGAMLATQHLIALGHQRIAFVNGRFKHEASHLRLQGYRNALKAAGISFDEHLVRGKDTWDEEGGYISVKHFMKLKKPPTAIFCANDMLAVGVLDALREGRIKVPQEVALVGFDNSLAAAQKRPPLTSVEMPFFEMGQRAAALVLKSLHEHRTTSSVYRMPCKLIQRESCGVHLAKSQRAAYG
jgi:DNA-binding LacI/PurR family transcriptional regulator